MASEKTPTHKRIKRAEAGRNDWKVKALERRNENQKLKYLLKSKEEHLLELSTITNEQHVKLTQAVKMISKLESEIEILKKKPVRG